MDNRSLLAAAIFDYTKEQLNCWSYVSNQVLLIIESCPKNHQIDVIKRNPTWSELTNVEANAALHILYNTSMIKCDGRLLDLYRRPDSNTKIDLTNPNCFALLDQWIGTVNNSPLPYESMPILPLKDDSFVEAREVI